MTNNCRRTERRQHSCDVRQVKQIDVLPDEVLLDIFDFSIMWWMGEWQTLVHVCRRWRSIVLGSPRRLNLQLFCSSQSPTRAKLDIWPALLLIIWGPKLDKVSLTEMDNIFAVLEQSNRICEVRLWEIMDWHSESFLALMQVPFPELRVLELSSGDTTLSIPDSFLGGSAPRLESLKLCNFLFPGLPKLLSSATHLVELSLNCIPHFGYISPETMADLIPILSSLRTLSLLFEEESLQSFPDRAGKSLPPTKRSIIHALHEFHFRGFTEYLEDLLTRIDTPQLNIMEIEILNEIDFDCTRLVQFINSTPKLRTPDEAHVELSSINIRYGTSEPNVYNLVIRIPNKEPHWQLSSIEQVCNSSLQPLSVVEDLYIKDKDWLPVWEKDAVENKLWLQHLLPYTAAKNLYLSKEIVPSIAAALQELVGDRITEMLPSLQNIFVEEPESLELFQEMFEQFVTARQLSCHPVAILSGKEMPSTW